MFYIKYPITFCNNERLYHRLFFHGMNLTNISVRQRRGISVGMGGMVEPIKKSI